MVSTVPYAQCGSDGHLHDWPMEDAEMGGLCLHGTCSCGASHCSDDRRLEYHGAVGAGCRYRRDVFPNIEDEMRTTPSNTALQRLKRSEFYGFELFIGCPAVAIGVEAAAELHPLGITTQ